MTRHGLVQPLVNELVELLVIAEWAAKLYSPRESVREAAESALPNALAALERTRAKDES